ncbi:uncharacterized protein LOC132925683 [Rhopalosiphum padi]|uniref:uncharacterized protein LOC132925683 n=1 Tax=Rhopalosiphum padi TaxID=40932 RepID=UPI00298E9DE7|nr:uncharacterized protein LOC132925683 [Rhopalosiphum padi]
MWSVINFINDNTVEVVPSFWVHKTNCAWPKKNAAHFIKRRIPPNKFDFNYLPAKKMCNDLDDYIIAKQKAKASEDTSNISSSNETYEERLTRFQKTKKKVMKNNLKIKEKLKWNTSSLESPTSSIDEEEDSSEKDPGYSKNVICEKNTIIHETPPSKQKLISKDLPQTFPGTSFKSKLDFSTMNKCKSLSPKPKMSNAINFDEVEKIITTSSSPFKVTVSNSIPHSNNDILTKINRTTLNTWYEIKGLVERIESLENALLNKGFKEVFNDDLENGLIFSLPLSNEEELEIFEKKLLDTAFNKKLISELSRLVRGTLPSTVRSIM